MALTQNSVVKLDSGMGTRLLAGFGSNFLAQVISGLQPILLTPLFLTSWGPDVYGRWLALTAAVSYLTLIDLGGQSYIGNILAMHYARGESQEFRQKLSEAVSFFVAFVLIIWVLMVCAIFLLLPINSRFALLPTLSITEQWLVLLISTNLLITIPAGIFVTVYRATGHFSRGQMMGNAIRIFEFTLYILLLWIRIKPVHYALAILCMTIVRAYIIPKDIISRIPESNIRLNVAKAKAGRKYLSSSLFFWLISMSQALNQQGVLLILAPVVGAKSVSIYATHRTICGVLGYIRSTIEAPLWPEFSYLWANARQQALQSIAVFAIKSMLIITSIGAIFLWFIIPFIYQTWTNSKLVFDPVLTAIFLIQIVLAAGWQTSGWSLMAANQHRLIAIWSIANALFTIGTAFLFVRIWGIRGVAFATTLGDLLFGFFTIPYLAGGFLDIGRSKLLKQIILLCVNLSLLGIVVVLAEQFVTTWWLWVGFISIIGFWIYFLIRGITTEIDLMQLYSNLLKRRKLE